MSNYEKADCSLCKPLLKGKPFTRAYPGKDNYKGNLPGHKHMFHNTKNCKYRPQCTDHPEYYWTRAWLQDEDGNYYTHSKKHKEVWAKQTREKYWSKHGITNKAYPFEKSN